MACGVPCVADARAADGDARAARGAGPNAFKSQRNNNALFSANGNSVDVALVDVHNETSDDETDGFGAACVFAKGAFVCDDAGCDGFVCDDGGPLPIGDPDEYANYAQ